MFYKEEVENESGIQGYYSQTFTFQSEVKSKEERGHMQMPLSGSSFRHMYGNPTHSSNTLRK